MKICKLAVVLISLAAFTHEYMCPKTYYNIGGLTSDYMLQNVNSHWFIFTTLLAMQTAVIARPFLSVSPSVHHPSHSGIVSRRMKIRSCGFRLLVGQAFSF